MSERKLKSNSSETIYFTSLVTPLGLMGLAASEQGLVRIALKLASENRFKKILKESFPGECLNHPPHFKDMLKQLKRYFSGELKKFTCQLDLRQGTPFQQRVWRRLTSIPYGKTLSYGTLAQSIGHPKAFRAVGNANGKNPLPLIIPCHRVIRENGGLGGYSCGLDIKKFLLDLENS